MVNLKGVSLALVFFQILRVACDPRQLSSKLGSRFEQRPRELTLQGMTQTGEWEESLSRGAPASEHSKLHGSLVRP